MRRAGALTGVALLVVAAGTANAQEASAAAAGTGAPVQAVWVPKDLAFTYMGFTTHYSCDGIEDKVRSVLRSVGAEHGFKVTVSGCVNLTGPEIMPRVRVRAALPREATPEVLAELAKAQPTHAGGKKAAPAKPFAATWRSVEFRGTDLEDVQRGDCELMEQLVREVLVPLGAREAEGSRTNCVPHQLTLDAVRVTLLVLQPSPAATEKAP